MDSVAFICVGNLKTLIELEDGSGARSNNTLDTAARKLTKRNHSCDNSLVAVGRGSGDAS
jgi:hypothetical protein